MFIGNVIKSLVTKTSSGSKLNNNPSEMSEQISEIDRETTKTLHKVICAKCRKLRPYDICIETDTTELDGEVYEYDKRKGYCRICKSRVTVPGLDDLNAAELERVVEEQMNGMYPTEA